VRLPGSTARAVAASHAVAMISHGAGRAAGPSQLGQPVLPAGFRFRTADEAGAEAAVRAHTDAWASTAYTAESYEGVRQAAAYRGDLHVLVEAPIGAAYSRSRSSSACRASVNGRSSQARWSASP
jgi:hypothetical protein